MLVRTNHFVSDGGRDGCLASTISTSTEVRRAHLVETFADRMPLTPHRRGRGDDPPRRRGWRVPAPDTGTDPVLWHRTLATVAIDAAARTLDVRPDGPCGRRLMPVEQTV